MRLVERQAGLHALARGTMLAVASLALAHGSQPVALRDPLAISDSQV